MITCRVYPHGIYYIHFEALSACLTGIDRADLESEAPNMSWSFFVNHFQNETQARRDNKFTYRTNNGSYYHGLDPPDGAEP